MLYFRLFFLFLFLFSCSSSWAWIHIFTKKIASDLIGKFAQDAYLDRTDGTKGSVIGSREGKKAILVFWSTWCPPCYTDIGVIDQNFASIEEKGIKIILVDAGEPKQDVIYYFKKRHMNLISYVDVNSDMQRPYRLTVLPTLFFIDENGIIRSVTHQFPSDYENYFSDNKPVHLSSKTLETPGSDSGKKFNHGVLLDNSIPQQNKTQ
jgi:thiol-disulfide isomerase/thioredoxin